MSALDDTGLAFLEARFSKFVPPERTTGRYSDAEVEEISRLLQSQGRNDWALHPRLCIVLYLISGIDGLTHMDNLIKEGHRDTWFPYRGQELPSNLDPGVSARFIRDQDAVLAKELIVKDGVNLNLADGELESVFDFGERLGAGGSGEVFTVKRRTDGQPYALKRIHKQKAFEMGRKYFTREMESLTGTVHHHIIQYIGSFATPTHVGIIMSPIAECNLETFLVSAQQQNDKKSWLWTYFGCLAHALRYLHYTRKVRHKDIKLSNILIRERTVLLTDFGLAYDWGATPALRSTTETEKFRTAKYCAPEVVKRKPVNHKSDIFSLGCVFLEIITVLRGEWLQTMNTFFRENGEEAQTFSGNLPATSLWIQRLKSNERPQDENRPFVWIEQMLEEDPKRRPNSKKLVKLIWSPGHDSDQSTNSTKFHGICCTESEEETAFGVDSLRDAITTQDEEHLTQLLDTGTNPNLKDIEGLTALHRSSQNGQISLVRLLLERGRNIHIDEKDKDGKSALHWAAENGHAEVATLLMEKGADVNAIEPVFRYTPLHTAAWNGHESVVRRLLEKKPNLTAKTKAGHTAEDLAKMWPYEGIAQLLKVRASEGGEKGNGERRAVQPRTKTEDGKSGVRARRGRGGMIPAKGWGARKQERTNDASPKPRWQY